MIVQKRVLVLGGRGFIGRYVARELSRRHADVHIGTRGLQPLEAGQRKLCMHELPPQPELEALLGDIDVVVNSVGILRERKGETYEQVHHIAVAKLARACARTGTRLLHVSALGLNLANNNEFCNSKRRGEVALEHSGANWRIIRASLVDGPDGYGAAWFRRLAAWPLHFYPIVPDEAKFSPIDVNDLAEAVAILALENNWNAGKRIFEVSVSEDFSLDTYLERLRGGKPLLRVPVPDWLMRRVVALCDLINVTALTDGHYKLLQFRNAPLDNCLADLLERAPRPIRANGVSSPAALHHPVKNQRHGEANSNGANKHWQAATKAVN